jgi:hypothetical protein
MASASLSFSDGFIVLPYRRPVEKLDKWEILDGQGQVLLADGPTLGIGPEAFDLASGVLVLRDELDQRLREGQLLHPGLVTAVLLDLPASNALQAEGCARTIRQ